MNSSTSSSDPVLSTDELNPTRFLCVVAVSALVVVLAFWAVTIYLPLGFLPAEYSMWVTRERWIDKCELTPTIILGDSRAVAGFLPSHIPDATNLALGGATSVEMFYQSEKLLKCPVPPKTVILSISPGLFTRSGWFWDRTGLYGVLSFSQLEEIRTRSRALHDTTLFSSPKFADSEARMDNWLHAIHFPSYYTTYILSHLGVGRLAANQRVQRETLAARGQHFYGSAEGSNDIADDATLKQFVPSPLLDEYLERMLTEYQRHGTTVDFIAVPMNHATYSSMDPAVIAAFQQHLQQIAARHPNFHIIGPAVDTLDDRYFGDSTHLNSHGAQLLSDRTSLLLKSQTELSQPVTAANPPATSSPVTMASSTHR